MQEQEVKQGVVPSNGTVWERLAAWTYSSLKQAAFRALVEGAEAFLKDIVASLLGIKPKSTNTQDAVNKLYTNAPERRPMSHYPSPSAPFPSDDDFRGW